MNHNGIPLQTTIPPEALRPLVQAIVAEVLQTLEDDRAKLNGRLAYTEPEAAELLGMRQHQLRDLRLAGRIGFTRGPKASAWYSREDLLKFMADNHEPKPEGRRRGK
jgi:hypothetical protein